MSDQIHEVTVGGLLPHVEDERDYEYAVLGGIFGDYTPKHDRLVLDTLTVKNQADFNTCVWNSLAVQRELTEKVPLSVKSIVCFAKQRGYLSGNGYSTLREGQKAAAEYGVAEESLLPDVKSPWDSYSSSANLNPSINENATKHRSKSYFSVASKDDYLKALDDGNAIHCGMDWYTSYNMGGGLTAPWVLPWATGVMIGGHAILCIGYDIPKQLLIFQNSYGESWGDKGKFYVRFSDWFKERRIGYVSVDLDEPTLSQVVAQYEGKQVKSANSPVIYLIQDGKKRAFPDETTFYAFGGRFGENKTWQLVSQSVLDIAPNGEPMDITQSRYWNVLKDNWEVIRWLQFPNNFETIQKKIESLGEKDS